MGWDVGLTRVVQRCIQQLVERQGGRDEEDFMEWDNQIKSERRGEVSTQTRKQTCKQSNSSIAMPHLSRGVT